MIRSLSATLLSLSVCTGIAVAQQPSTPLGASQAGAPNANSPRYVGTEGALEIIDFEGLPAGTILSSIFTNKGSGPILIQSRSPILGNNNANCIFDSSHPTGNDPDLGSPNQDFGGPGMGVGGEAGSPFANTTALGNILIIPLNLIDANGDGLVDDPNDVDLVGSTHEFDFSVIGPVSVHGITLIDIEEERLPSVVEFYDADNNPVGPTPLALTQTGDNGVANINFGTVSNVSRMVVTMNGSGAIDNVVIRSCDPCINVATQCLDAPTPEGDIQVFGTVTNCGNTDLNNVTVVDDQLGQVLGPISLAPGEEAMYSGTYTPTMSPSTNTAVATGSPPEGCETGDVTSMASSTCSVGKCHPCLEVTVECMDAPLGSQIPVMGTVRNCGDVTLTGVSAFDSGLGVVISLITLEPNEEATFAGAYTPLSNPTINTTTAIGTPPPICGMGNVTASDSAECAIICNPCITIDTECMDASGPDGMIQVSGTVTNCGDVGIVNINVVDDQIGNPVSNASLGPGAMLTYSGSYSRTTNPSTNTATVTGDPVAVCNLPEVSDTDSSTCGVPCGPCISVDTECTSPTSGGDPVMVSGTVTNCGDVTLTNVTVTDDQLGVVVNGITLDAGDSQTYSGSYAPMSNPTTNTAMASGTPPDLCNSRDVTAMDSATCDLCTGSIGDFVWNDLNMDGIQDPGEPGKPNVEVCLYDDAGNLIACTTTDENGFYEFGDLCAGDYVVIPTPVPGFTPSPCEVGNDPAVDSNCIPANVNLPTNDSHDDTIDFGCFEACTGRIGDFVWHDQNENNVQDPGEPGIPGVVVLLCDANGDEITSTVTDMNGMYLFEELCAGMYKVKVLASTVPPEFGPVICDYGMDDAIDSDCQPVCVTLKGNNDECLTKDFGYSFCGECSGKVSELTLRWLGTETVMIEVQQANGEVRFSGIVDPNGTFSFFGTQQMNTLGPRITIFVDGVETTEIHTSCSQPIGAGFVFGLFEVVAGRSRNGGVFCPAECGPCDGGVTAVCLVYFGLDPANVEVREGRTVLFSGLLAMGDQFCVGGTNLDGTFGSGLDVYVNRSPSFPIATDCSQDLAPATILGDFMVVGAWSLEGGPICTSEELGCRMTGGGNDEDGAHVYTFGGQAGAPTASQPQPYGEWTHHQSEGPEGDFVFHVGTASAPEETEIDLITCSDPMYCHNARPAPAKQLDFEGVGAFNNVDPPFSDTWGIIPNVTLHWVEVHVEDLGEPGSHGDVENCPPEGSAGSAADCACPDFYRIRIHATEDPGSTVIYEVRGYLDGGNIQLHPPIGG